MAEKKNAKKKFNPVILIVLVLVLALGAFLIYQSVNKGGETTCEALVKGYKEASVIEDYHKVSEYYGKLMEKGCKF
jgi:hypothetical protein